MTLSLDKGPASSFQTIYNRLRRDWYHDTIDNPASILLQPEET